MNIVFRYHPLHQLFVELVLRNLLVMGTMHFPRQIYLVLRSIYFLTFRILFGLKNLFVLFISSLCSALVYYHLIHKVYSVALYLKEFCGYISILSNSNSLHVPEWPCCCSTYHVLSPSLIFRTSTAQKLTLRIHMCIF